MKLKQNIIHVTLLLTVFLYSFKAGEDKKSQKTETDPPFVTVSTPWADSIFKNLNSEEANCTIIYGCSLFQQGQST